MIYATPQMTGQVIDKQTNKPLEGVETIINSQAMDYLDAQGYFTVPPTTYNYTVIEPNHKNITSVGNYSFTISKSGYEIKSYANGGLAYERTPFNEVSYANMGKIYLMTVPVGEEREYMTYYPTLDYCKPTQSQLEVDCIPVPEGKTYEEVSPNQPIQ